MEIIHPSSEQWPEYRQIRLAALREEPQAFARPLGEEKKYAIPKWRERAENDYTLLAFENNRPIGVISAYVSEEEGERIAHIISVFVLRQFRGRGIGKELFGATLEKIKQDPDIKKVVLSVNKEQVPAVRMYRQFGFQITGEKPQLLGDGREHLEYEMELTLKK